MMWRRDLLRGAGGQFGLLLVAQIVSAVLQAVSLVLVARWVQPAAFGWFAAAVAFLAVVIALSDMGLATFVTRLRARDRDDPNIGLSLTAVRKMSAAAGVVGLGLAFLLFDGASHPLDLALLACLAVGDRWMQAYLGVAIADGRTHVNVIALGVSRAGILIGVLGVHTLTALSAITAYGISGAVMGLVGYAIARTLVGSIPKPTETAESVGSLIRRAWPFWVASMSQLVRTLDVSIVALVASPLTAGLYAVPSRLTGPLRLLPTTLNKMTIPYASRGDTKTIASLRRVMYVVLALMAVIFAVVFVFTELILRLTVGESYLDAAWPLRILLLGVLMNVAGSFKSGLLQGSGEQVFIAKLGAFLAVLFLAGVGVASYFFGAIGAASAATFVYAVQLVCVSRRSPRDEAMRG